ncbi:amino acid ABC transporter substrate-binding protein [Hwanghaeella grinnelliae]|uniref:Amino acid ABC transporter substrate-binding protein n=1 Tax=Hwanghaeella grinnelliae TaxID=2500179 RepID=A0A437QVH6_9PROT|nr:transporter substrate-binding domain-containing protein [Hwanghaeella grinnelliae]RVU38436.1 amino acid ABC transporter substrate-binding protein [Hwanghaeella grinnelliae]
MFSHMRMIAAAAAATMAIAVAVPASARDIEEVVESKTFRIGVVPYDHDVIKDPSSGEYKGVFIDAIQHICNDIEVECEFQEYTWQSFIGALQAGQVDLSIASTFATIKRATAVIFSVPIYNEGYKAVVKEGETKFKTVEDLNSPDAMIAVAQGTGQMDWVKKVAPEAQLRVVPTEEGALLEVVTGRAMISISGAGAANHALETQPTLTTALGGEVYDVNQIAWAMNRNDIQMKLFVDTALGKLKASGVLKEIAYKYDAPWKDLIAD